jgi:hypothetical protein
MIMNLSSKNKGKSFPYILKIKFVYGLKRKKVSVILIDDPDAWTSSQKHFRQYFGNSIVCKKFLLNNIIEKRLFGLTRDHIKHRKDKNCSCAYYHVNKFFVETNN